MSFQNYKEILFELVKREIKSRYKQSVFGYAWVLLVPLINLIVMSIVFSFFIRVPTGGIPYAIYLFAGLVPWLFTANAVISATGSAVQNNSLITKVALPRHIFPLASVLSKTIDFFLNFVIMIILMILLGIHFNWVVLFLPLIFITQFILILGVGFVLSSINVYFRDVENIIGVFLTMWMYLTPVLYPPEIVPQNVKYIFNLNPMTPIINSYRNLLLHGVLPPWQSFAYSLIISILLFFVGWHIFKKLSRNFADVI